MTPSNQSAAANRRPAGQSDGSDDLSATLAADQAFPAAVAELGSYPTEVTQSLTITELSAHPAHSDRVLDWLRSTWSDDNDEFAATMIPADDRPGALIALIGDTPAGVLAFKRYKTSLQMRPELWINALYVVPDQRRLGIGRKLVQFGSERSIPKFTDQLFVYTDIPSLYEGLGWEHLDFSSKFGTHTLRYQRKATILGRGE